MLLLLLVLTAQEPASPEAYLAAHHAADVALGAGDLDSARRGFERCAALSPDNPTVAYGRACVAARAGDAEAALAHLDDARRLGFADAALARWDEDLAGLRERPEFERFLAGSGALLVGAPASTDLRHRLGFDGKWVAHGALDDASTVAVLGDSWGRVHLFDPRTGATRRTILAFERPVWAVDASPDGRRVAALGYDGTFGLWNVEDGQHVSSELCLRGRDDKGWDFGAQVEFDPTGAHVFAAGRDGGGALFSRRGDLIARWDEPFGGFFGVTFAWSADGRELACARGNEVHVLSALDGSLARRFVTPAPVASIAFAPDGASLATGHDEALVRIWSWPAGDLRREYRVQDIFMDQLRVPRLAFSPDGERLALSSASAVNVEVLDAASGERVWGSGMIGGRMGEPVDVRWAGDTELWWAWRSGAIEVNRLDLVEPRRTPRPALGRIPDFGADGLATSTCYGGLMLFERAGGARWQRLPLPSGDTVLVAPSGHVAGRFDLSPELELYPVGKRAAVPLRDVIERAYDPKRVRAAIAGVPLVPLL